MFLCNILGCSLGCGDSCYSYSSDEAQLLFAILESGSPSMCCHAHIGMSTLGIDRLGIGTLALAHWHWHIGIGTLALANWALAHWHWHIGIGTLGIGTLALVHWHWHIGHWQTSTRGRQLVCMVLYLGAPPAQKGGCHTGWCRHWQREYHDST